MKVADRTATATNTPVDGTPTPDAPCTVRSYAFAGSPGLNGNRTGLTETVHADGNCTGTGATATSTRSYDGADRQTTAAAVDGAPPTGSYAYDPFGRQTTLPAGDAPDPAKGDVTLGYYDSDLPAWVQQNTTRTTYTLDVANHRLVSTTGPDGGTPTSTTTRHHTDGSDNPTWVDVDNDANGPNPALTTRFAESLGGDLGAQIGDDGSADLTLATLHGDTASTLTLPATQDESTSATGINAWSDHTEYGTSRDTASTDTVDGPVGYGWLGARQRSTTPESAGLTLMGDRYYNPTTGRFTATDPEPGGNTNTYTYTYPNDPINRYDLSGHRSSGASINWLKAAGDLLLNLAGLVPGLGFLRRLKWLAKARYLRHPGRIIRLTSRAFKSRGCFTEALKAIACVAALYGLQGTWTSAKAWWKATKIMKRRIAYHLRGAIRWGWDYIRHRNRGIAGIWRGVWW